MVISEAHAGGGHCGGTTWSASSVRQALPPFQDVQLDCQGWARSRAQQQLLWDTLQSIKDKASLAFTPTNARQPVDPYRETYSDGGLFGTGCNYAVGFHGIQGRQPKSEDYVLHLALGPNLFAPFEDCTRACLACVLDGHGGTGAVQYVAERFPSYLLADLPRLRAQPAAAMRSALHRIDEELTALGHNSGTTVNALLLIDNCITVVNTGDCRCILYDWVDERAVQVTHDHNLHCTRERERVLGEGAELSGCGGYVVLPCPTDGAKLLGVTKALGHAGVKALQRSFTVGSLNGILGSGHSPHQESQQQELLPHLSQAQQQQQALPRLVETPAVSSQRAATSCVLAAWDQGPSRKCPEAAAQSAIAKGGMAYALSGSGMSDDYPVMPASASVAVNGGSGVGFLVDVDVCSSCLALTGCSCPPVSDARGQVPLLSPRDNVFPLPTVGAPAVVASTAANCTNRSSIECAPVFCSAAAATPPLQRCSSINYKSSFANAAGAAVAAAVASSPVGFAHFEADAGQVPPLAFTGTGGSFMLTCEPDEFEFTVEDDRHVVILGCDGVFDRMGNAEACKTAVRQLTASNSCVDAAREVTHRACRLGSLDNITALVLRFGRKPIVRRQSFSVLSLRRSSSNMSNDLAAAGGSTVSRA